MSYYDIRRNAGFAISIDITNNARANRGMRTIVGISGRLTITVVLFLAASAAQATEEDLSQSPVPPSGAKSAASGVFLPWTMGARSDAQRALVFVQGGYNGAENGGVYQMAAEAQLFGRCGFRFIVNAGIGPS